MRKVLFATVLALCCVSVEAEAFPVQPGQPGPSPVITVAQGCGVGWHRGPYGGCRPNAVRRCWWRTTP